MEGRFGALFHCGNATPLSRENIVPTRFATSRNRAANAREYESLSRG